MAEAKPFKLWWVALLGAGAGFAIVDFSGWLRPAEATPPPKLQGQQASSSVAAMNAELQLLSAGVTKTSYNTTIEGKIKNNSSRKYLYAEVTFTLYDKNDKEIGITVATTLDLPAGATWNYRAFAMMPAERFEFTRLTGR
jgi:hypothetical protein